MIEYSNKDSNLYQDSKLEDKGNLIQTVSSSPIQNDSYVKEPDSTNLEEHTCSVDVLVSIDVQERNNFDKDVPSLLPDSTGVDDTTSINNSLEEPKANNLETSSTIKGSNSLSHIPPKQRLKYSRDQLLKLMDVPASRLWPVYFDITFQKPQGKIDLDRWMRAKQDSQRGSGSIAVNVVVSQANGVSTTTQNTIERLSDLELKRSRDPRDRVKQEEQDGIVLSPQRRSFGTGCHAFPHGPQNQPIVNGPEVPLERPARESHREVPARRIGSGRILRREEPEQVIVNERRRERDPEKENDARRDHKEWRIKNESRYEREERHDKRRRFFEEEEKRKTDRKDGRDRRYPENRRGLRESEEEAPEWFTGGPSSQNEYIELVGFEEADEQTCISKSKRDRRRSKREKDGSHKGSRSNTPIILQHEENIEMPEQSRNENEFKTDVDPPTILENLVVVEPPMEDQDVMQFNIEDYLGDLLNIGSDETAHSNAGASRLKQFFKDQESSSLIQGANSNSRQSSMDTNNQLTKFLEFSDPMMHNLSPNIGVDPSLFFSPISPAENTNGDAIANLFQHSNAQKAHHSLTTSTSGRFPPPSVKDLILGGKGQSLEEIEANLHRGQRPAYSGISNNVPPPSINTGAQHCGKGTQINQDCGLYPKNPFNDFLSQVSRSQTKIVAEQNSDCDNLLAKLLMKDSISSKSFNGRNPALPNNAPTETELISRLMKGHNVNPVNGCTSSPHMNSQGVQQRFFSPQQNMANLSVPPQTLATPNMSNHSPSRSHLLPPQHIGHPNQDIILKLMQNQQQLQNQKKQMLHQNYSQQQQHLDPIKQLLGGMNNLRLSPTHHAHDMTVREALLRPDVQNLLQCVLNGQVKETQLIGQLSSNNTNFQQREAITTVLKLLNNPQAGLLMPPRSSLTPSPTPQNIIGGALSLGTPSLSPRVSSPISDAANMLAPHVMQQTRVSPLMFSGGNIPGSGPRRTPSHQELVVHAQSILQKALLKQELEKAKEKHRKREAERTRSPNPPLSMHNGPSSQNSNAHHISYQERSPSKGTKCQSPLVFTPTSVMRKMTAERDRLEKVEKLDGMNVHLHDKPREHLSSAVHNIPCPTIQQNHEVSVLQNSQDSGSINQQMMRNVPSNMHIPHSLHSLQSRFPVNNSANQISFSNNNNNYKQGEPNLQLGLPMTSGSCSQRNSPVSLVNLFSREIASQGQAGGMPELPDGKVLSLEEVERLQHSHSVLN